MASTDSVAVVAWDDTRNGDEVTQSQDILTSVVQYRVVGGGVSKNQQYALAAVTGVLAVGLLMVVVAAVSRRRNPDPPAASA